MPRRPAEVVFIDEELASRLLEFVGETVHSRAINLAHLCATSKGRGATRRLSAAAITFHVLSDESLPNDAPPMSVDAFEQEKTFYLIQPHPDHFRLVSAETGERSSRLPETLVQELQPYIDRSLGGSLQQQAPGLV